MASDPDIDLVRVRAVVAAGEARVPADDGKFRNVVPKTVEDMLKQHQIDAWENRI